MITHQIKLGKFARDAHGSLYGRICGLGIGSTMVVSQEVTSREGKLYLKLIADSATGAYEVGAAFPKEKDGMTYYSVNLDSPLFPAPLNAMLFPDKGNEGMYNLIWSRTDIYKLSVDTDVVQGQAQTRRFVGASMTPNA